jgi:hypothetical protein
LIYYHLHVALWENKPPMSGPMPLPIAIAEPRNPWYFPLSFKLTISETMIIAILMMPPPPAPEIPRKMIN